MYQFNTRSPFARDLAFNYWYVDDTFHDFSDHNHPAAIRAGTTTATLTTIGSKIGRPAALIKGNGTNERFDLGSITSSNPISFYGQTQVTWNWWARRDSSGGNINYPRIMDKSDGGSGANGWALYEASNDNWLQVAGGSGYKEISIVNYNVWHMYTLTYDQVADRAVWYRDGRYIDQTTTGTNNAFPATTTNAAIGNWNHSTDRNWNGGLLNVTGWSRHLTRGEIARLYNPVSRFDLIAPKRPTIFIPEPAVGGNVTTVATPGSIQYTGQTVTSEVADAITTVATPASIQYAGATVTSTVASSVLTAAVAASIQYTGATTTSTVNLADNSATTVATAASIQYAGVAVTSSVVGNASTAVTAGSIQYTGTAVTSTVADAISTAVTAGSVQYSGVAITSTIVDNLITAVTAGSIQYAGATVTSTASNDVSNPEDFGWLPSLRGDETVEELRRKRNARYRYLSNI